MFSPQYIQALSDKAARQAARAHREPYVVYDEAEVARLERAGRLPFPFVGDYVPPGWRKVAELFCDSSGLGADDEPALSQSQLFATLRRHLQEPASYGYAVIRVGQFQCYVGVFVQDPDATAQRARSQKPARDPSDVWPRVP